MAKTLIMLLVMGLTASWASATDFTNFLGIQFVDVPSGKFFMGSCVPVNGKTEVEGGIFGLGNRSVCLSGGKVDLKSEKDEHPQHEVKISQEFQIGAHEVTSGQFTAYLEDSGRVVSESFKKYNAHGEEAAVVWVSWFQVQSFIDWLNQKKPPSDRKSYRLPTEAEWEYVARAGSTGSYFFGEQTFQLTRYAWIIKDSQQFGQIWSQPVGKKRPNPWGVYDIYGNVWEWVQDVYQEDYYQNTPAIDPKGPLTGPFQVVRGCSLFASARNCRSANRHYLGADKRDASIGFRLVRQ